MIRGFWNQYKFRLIVPCVILVFWEIISRSGLFPSALLPPPSKVLAVWLDWVFGINGSAEVNSGAWVMDVLSSGMRVMSGYLIAVVVGVSMGVAIGWSKFIEKLLEPTIQMLRPIPPVSWIPLAIIWFGIANKPAIFLVFIGSFFPIVINAIQGVKTTDKNLIRAASMMGAKQWKLIRYVILPAALPSIFTGLRLGIGIAWALTVTAEMVAVKSGLGYVLWDSYYFLRYDLVIASMASIGLMGFLMDVLIKKVMDRMLHWQRNTSIEGMK
ncbi:ABC transporter permease [Paenibacillus agricola]|uniref:ABC transporter permease n=1 Tax=Paenibacillus agricola TaxID=2716264 RepID=A0ABX0J9A7_9BACL|nr:ABC transporter permease [Paenibacillus agricola]NHN31891.1 ABC transporter permease [Paenibacillus agricola]